MLSAAELQDFVDQQPDAAGSGDVSWPSKGLGDLKYLLGRRLVREDRYQDAARYIKPPYDKVLAKYVQALNNGTNEKLSQEERARAWFTAAWWRGMMAWNSWEAKLPPMDLIRAENSKMWTWQSNGLPGFGHYRPMSMVRKQWQKFRLS